MAVAGALSWKGVGNMWRSLVSSIGAAVTAIGSAVNAALGAISGGVLTVATALAPKAPPPAEPGWYDGGGGACTGGRDWRGPFPTLADAREYQSDIPVPSYIYKYADGWWLYVPKTR